MPDDPEFELWWEQTWNERHDELERVFGPTEPPGIVKSFSWKEPAKVIPGACAMTFRPCDAGRSPTLAPRDHWLYVTHGLAQPAGPEAVRRGRDAGVKTSGRGLEFALVAREPVDWAASTLYWLLTYLTEPDARPIEAGHRVPLGFQRRADDSLAPLLFPQDDDPCVGTPGALLFWPYLFPTSTLVTSTGSFTILVGTYITAEDYVLARAKSSAHLLLLLVRVGIGQGSDPARAAVVLDAQAREAWREITALDEAAVRRELDGVARGRRS